jgi:uncharacterized protein (DUF2249 family)
MSVTAVTRQPGERWHDAQGVHIEVRGLAPPAPFVQIIQLVESLKVPSAIIVHHDRDPLPLYDELAQRGWSANRIEGDAGEFRLRLAKNS